jgi:energy-coupling factor transporter transmembrane protein EcfT
MTTRAIDPRAWLCWAGAAMLGPLMGRNPFALLSVLLAVTAVREALPADARSGWAWVVRLGIVFAAISVLFNLLTVRAGDRVIGSIPGWVPLVDGDLTLNSVVFGLLSGLAILTLVLIGVTLSAVLDWSAVLRLLPSSLTGAGVAGSVAFSFFPQMLATYREIVDAQAVRGQELQGPRDYLNLAPLLLSGGIERAVTMSELLESRGFGGAPAPPDSRLRQFAPAFGLTGLCAGAYLFAVGRPEQAATVALLGLGLLVLTVRAGRGSEVRRTRYRALKWKAADWVVTTGAIVAVAAILLVGPDAVRYEPYPSLAAPVASVPLAVGLLGLLGPAAVLLWLERTRV